MTLDYEIKKQDCQFTCAILASQ